MQSWRCTAWHSCALDAFCMPVSPTCKGADLLQTEKSLHGSLSLSAGLCSVSERTRAVRSALVEGLHKVADIGTRLQPFALWGSTLAHGPGRQSLTPMVQIWLLRCCASDSACPSVGQHA